MKKSILLFLGIFVALTFSFAQSAPKSPAMTAENSVAKVKYGAPSKKDREIFGKLVPFGKVWRTGANEGTEITFTKDVMFGGKPVKAGTYTLFTIPNEKEWTVILNSELKQWGSYGYEKIKDKNVVEVNAATKSSPEAVEQFKIALTENNMSISWDKTMVEVSIK